MDLYNGALLLKARSFAVYPPFFLSVHIALLVDRLAENIEHSAEGLFTDRNLDTRTCGCDLHILAQSLAGCEHNAAHDAVAHVLSHLHNALFAVDLNGESVSYHRELSRSKFNIYNTPHDLCYSALFHRLLLSPKSALADG